MGHGVEIQHSVIFDEPERRAHPPSVSAVALQVQILLVGELSELVIAHISRIAFAVRVVCAPRTAPISRNAFVAKREEVKLGADEGDQQNDRYQHDFGGPITTLAQYA